MWTCMNVILFSVCILNKYLHTCMWFIVVRQLKCRWLNWWNMFPLLFLVHFLFGWNGQYRWVCLLDHTSLNHTWVAFECCGYTIFNFSLMALSFLFLFKKLHMCWAMRHPIYFASFWETLCAFFTISVWTKSFLRFFSIFL